MICYVKVKRIRCPGKGIREPSFLLLLLLFFFFSFSVVTVVTRDSNGQSAGFNGIGWSIRKKDRWRFLPFPPARKMKRYRTGQRARIIFVLVSSSSLGVGRVWVGRCSMTFNLHPSVLAIHVLLLASPIKLIIRDKLTNKRIDRCHFTTLSLTLSFLPSFLLSLLSLYFFFLLFSLFRLHRLALTEFANVRPRMGFTT